ncbi:TonB-dependent receptor [Duganella sp. BJB488]|uniref:TonB-dependent receptor n=1 Tax=unclassified Duganella TaxID=2636909 RepID=UPI000E34188E|nr:MULTISPECIES: TonB-dependent receptor [unclassified Duganella]RFP15197.1 TonB-dependent receptor [Duganella sp. BJB489]RFP19752.1 TonB-dependent receptor [Duganella sp. BJB488]RFP38140.1 TonB-dependent receptor [Duganella sp. BJB480]
MQPNKLTAAVAAAYGLLLAAAPVQARDGATPERSATAGVAAEAVATATPGADTANAESAAPSAATTTAADASLEVVARVTVSTRRRNETSQSVPTSMSVLDSGALEGNRVYRVQDLQQLLPSTTVNYVHARQMSFAVRGLGNNPASDGLEGSVGVYLDNVYLARPGMAAFDALDIQQLELLRGPQGTLFGKNTTAGVLNITTKQPTFRSENSAQLSLGQQDYVQAKAVLSGAFSDTAAGRIAAYKTHEGGYITNIYNGSKVQGGDREGVRAQLLLEPDNKLSARLIADYNVEDSNNGTLIFYSAGPGGKFLTQAAAVGGHPVTDPAQRQVNLDSGSHVDVHQGGLSGEVNWKLDNDYKFTSISAYRFWNFTPHNDDGLDVPVTLNVGASARHRQFTQELRLATPLGRPVESVFGAYYYYQNLDNVNFTYNGPLADKFNATPAGAWSNVTSIGNGHLRVNSYALFGQSIWHIDPRWDLTGGLRATYEDKLAQVTRDAPIGPAVGGPALASRNARYGAYNSGDLHLDNLSPSALLTLAYKVDADVLAFGSISHGEKSGGINLSVPGAAGVSSLKVNNEKANNLELGIKSNLLERRAQVNASLFWNEVKGYQSNAYDPVSATSYLTNAGNVRSRGLELDTSFVVARGFTLGANGSFNDVKYKEYKNAPCPSERPGAFCDLSGRAALVNAPRWIGNLSAQYAAALEANVEGYGNINYAYRSGTYGTLDASEYSRIPAYSLTNLSAGVKVKNGPTRWDISVWAKNVFDKTYYTSTWNTNPGAYNAVIGTPRQVGVTARADF